jgi:penicillin-binding protein
MNAAYDIKPELINPQESFAMPEGIVKRSYCAISGLLPSEACSKAGLIDSDYFNVNDVPTMRDDSLISSGKYVQIGDKRYSALDSTPSEFAKQGLMLNPDFVERMVGKNFNNTSQLIPKRGRWGSIFVPNAKMLDNGKSPDGVSLSVSGNKLSWTSSSDNDVVGYRVYKGGSKVASVISGSSLSYTASDGDYYVTAVDIAGNESAPSKPVKVGEVSTPPPKPVKSGEVSTTPAP